MSKILSKRYGVHLSFEFAHEVTPEEVQQAILRATQTAAFAIPGKITVDQVIPSDDIPQMAARLPIGNMGP